MSTTQTPSDPDTHERYVRWQKYQIDQMTFAQNLFLGLSVGALAYGVGVVRENGFDLPRCPKKFLLFGLGSFAFSILLGCVAVVSRLLDFRSTASKIRADHNNQPDDAAIFRDRYKTFGKLTWALFWFEFGTFLLGLGGLIVGVYARYGYRL